MKAKLIVSSAILATLLVAGSVSAQYSGPITPVAGASRTPYFTGPGGQAYMFVPDTASEGGYDDIQLASHLGGSSGCTTGCGSKGCTDKGCCDKGCSTLSCGTCCTGEDCCCGCNPWCHRVSVFADALYLRPRNAEVPYAVRFNGPLNPPGPAGTPPFVPIQTSAVDNLDPDYQAAFRAGFAFTIDGCSEVRVAYTNFETAQNGTVSAIVTPDPNDLVRSMVAHPSTFDAASDGLLAFGRQDIEFDLIDADYRRLFSTGLCHQYAWLVGVRYAAMEQFFGTQYGVNNVETVATDIDMEGVGLRVGFDGERSLYDRQLLGYLRTNASFVASSIRADYHQGNNFDATIVDTSFRAGRVVTILDLEVGAGWQSKCGTWRVTAGYVFNAWFNTIKTDEWINGVQNNNYLGIGSTITYDGVVGRVEARF